MEVLTKPCANKQYPTLAGIYLRTVYDTTSDECILLTLRFETVRFPFKVKAKHFHLKYVCLLPDSTKVENVFHSGVLDRKIQPNIPENQD